MKYVGKIVEYDGLFGTIVDIDGNVHFSKHDIFDGVICVGDIVAYRREEKNHDIFIARDISVLTKEELLEECENSIRQYVKLFNNN
jgi:hypothetical protein